MSTVWKVTKLYVSKQFQFPDCVIGIDWECSATASGFTAKQSGNCAVNNFAGPMVPYADLTEAQVLGWCWEMGVDKATVEAAVEAELDALVNPPIVTPPLPWATP